MTTEGKTDCENMYIMRLTERNVMQIGVGRGLRGETGGQVDAQWLRIGPFPGSCPPEQRPEDSQRGNHTDIQRNVPDGKLPAQRPWGVDTTWLIRTKFRSAVVRKRKSRRRKEGRRRGLRTCRVRCPEH